MSEFEPNPYAPGVVQQKPVLSDVEAVRHKHLSHEASIQSMGTLFLLSGLLATLAGVIYFVVAVGSLISASQTRDPGTLALLFLCGSGLFAIGVLQVTIAFGLRRLSRWTRVPAIVFSVLGLVLVPVGTLINGYFLFLLLSEKGTTVFSDQYKEVIRQTPHIKYKTSIVVWVFVGILVFMFLMAIFGSFVA